MRQAKWILRSLGLALIGIPVIAQIVSYLLLAGGILWSAAYDALPLPELSLSELPLALFYIAFAWAMFFCGRYWARKTNTGLNRALRQCLLLVPALVIAGCWIVILHLSNYSFESERYIWLLLVSLLWYPNTIGAIISGNFWLMMTVPVIAHLFFVSGDYVHCRRFANSGGATKWRNGMLTLLTILGIVAFWQAMLRAEKFASVDKANSVSEVLDTSLYRPQIQHSRLTPLEGNAPLQFKDSQPRLDGATALYPLYASAFWALYTFPAEMADYEKVMCCLANSRTPTAYQNIISGKADVIFVARPSEGQIKRAEEAGVKLVYTPIAREAFVFITHADNPVNGLSQQQVRDIFSGKISRWNMVGGDDRKISVWQRPVDSGSQTMMLKQVMKNTPMLTAQESETAAGMGGVIRKVAEYQNTRTAIGYTFRYYATQMNGDKRIKLLAIDGIAPTVENIAQGSYPYIADVYMVTRENPSAQTQQLVTWFLSPQGQRLVKDVGYVPLYPIRK